MSIIVLAALSFGFLPFLYHRIQDADWNSGIGPVLRWPDLGNLWGRDNSWGDGLTDRQFADLKRILDSKIKKHDDTLKRLESLLPGAVFVRKDNRGNVVIPSDFWDALKARVKQDGSIFTLDDKSRLSEKQWKSIQDRLRSDKTVNSIVSKEWEDWKKKNEDLVREHAKDSGKGHPSGGTIISRSYILNEIATALDKSKKEVEKEMVDLRKELHGLIRGIQSNLGHSHGKTGTAAPDGSTLSMEEITNLVQNIVAQKITDRQLALAAKTGKVLTRDSELRSHQANAFAAGNGAFVDLSLSSPTWARPKHSDGSSAWARAFKPGYYSQHTQALSPWSEPGHCWCAAVRSSTKDRKKPTSDLSVRMQNFIVPRHIVVEHINPELTIDPGSMPKDLEVWGVYDIPGRRDSVREFSLKQYPKQDEELLRQGLLQIGNFRYQYQAKDEGVYIHDMSKQLEQVDAATDQILIRAISNVGGVDHTCFYRVRLYGHERKGLARTDRRWWDDFEEDVA